MSKTPKLAPMIPAFFIVFTWFCNETTDPKQTTKNSLQTLAGEKWHRDRSRHFFCFASSSKKTTNLKSKKPRHNKTKTKTNDRRFAFLFFVDFFVCRKKERNSKGEIAKRRLTHCRCIKHKKKLSGCPCLFFWMLPFFSF